jgi:hypothetical protein
MKMAKYRYQNTKNKCRNCGKKIRHFIYELHYCIPCAEKLKIQFDYEKIK